MGCLGSKGHGGTHGGREPSRREWVEPGVLSSKPDERTPSLTTLLAGFDEEKKRWRPVPPSGGDLRVCC